MSNNKDIEEKRQRILDEMNARRIDGKTYIDSQWLLNEYETALTQHHEAEVERAVEAERIRLVKTGKLWVEVQEDNVSIRKVDLFDLTPTKTDKQTEV